ncbi:NAD(P)/FAD-dependent oxidoreductase [Aestuariivirga sp.]|uniref:NAD(P)/FAD-dependent oxidoreductase n=1 Tax=Aestuariivirga sp. TaxID=2650926 RepID=UPI0039E4A1F7
MAFGSSILSPDCSFDPFWWRAAPHETSSSVQAPPKSDVAIVGSGITGLVAAIELARAGRSVTVFDAQEPGHGASTRNAGYVGRTLKHGFGELIDSHGLDFAKAIYSELMEAFLAVKDTVARENIQCDFRQQGRFLMATGPAMYEAMAREFSLREKHLGEPFATVSRAEQKNEIATAHYFGGVRIDDHAGLHPGLYHKGLLDAARAAGVTIAGFTPVSRVGKTENGFALLTPKGKAEARDLIFATNGYSGDALPWLKRRVMPFDAYQTVSAPMDAARLRSLLPGDRTFIDWNFNVDWMRIAPTDPTRLIFGGLTGARNADLRIMAERLHARILRIFPELSDLRFDNVWTGKCGGTFDLYPHIGQHEGLHYAVGYCFAGVPMGTLFGRKLARRILGQPGGESAFDRPMPSTPLYWGNPWFVPYAINWMSRKDR